MEKKSIKKLNEEIKKLKLKRDLSDSIVAKRNYTDEIYSLEKEISEINQNYASTIYSNIKELDNDNLFDIMIINNLSIDKAKDYLYEKILDSNYDNLENYYETLLFLKEHNISSQEIDTFNVNLNTLLCSRKALSFVEAINNKEMTLKEIKIINNKIKSLKESTQNNAKSIDMFNRLSIRIDDMRGELKEFDKDVEIEVNELNNRKYYLYNKLDFYENHATGVRALKAPFKIKSANKELVTVEELLEIKNGELKKENEALDRNALKVWATITSDERELLLKSELSHDAVLSAIKHYIKDNSHTPIFVDMLNNSIKRAKEEIKLLSIKKESLENTPKETITNIDNKTYDSFVNNVYDKYPYLKDLSIKELENISEAKINSMTILAMPKDKKKTK